MSPHMAEAQDGLALICQNARVAREFSQMMDVVAMEARRIAETVDFAIRETIKEADSRREVRVRREDEAEREERHRRETEALIAKYARPQQGEEKYVLVPETPQEDEVVPENPQEDEVVPENPQEDEVVPETPQEQQEEVNATLLYDEPYSQVIPEPSSGGSTQALSVAAHQESAAPSQEAAASAAPSQDAGTSAAPSQEAAASAACSQEAA